LSGVDLRHVPSFVFYRLQLPLNQAVAKWRFRLGINNLAEFCQNALIQGMEEIKFRAWDGNRKTMIDWDELCYMSMVDGSIKWHLPAVLGKEMTNVHPMQFTGLKDKDGTEIYEGDLIRATPGDYAPREIYEVTWKTDSLRWDLPLPIGDHVVVGNIYENPHIYCKVSSDRSGVSIFRTLH